MYYWVQTNARPGEWVPARKEAESRWFVLGWAMPIGGITSTFDNRIAKIGPKISMPDSD